MSAETGLADEPCSVMNVDIVYLLFVPVSMLAFWRWPPERAALLVCLGGWVLLPVGHYPPGSADARFPYWIIGLAMPSDMLITKAWIAPATALLGTALFDRQALRALRLSWLDLPVALWCAWPFLATAFVSDARPAPTVASLYLAGCWLLPWLLGRLYFSSAEGQRLLAKGLALSALCAMPFSVLEGVLGHSVYGAVYEPHPFRFDGTERYLGYRPIGFFENGNQFGLWVALCALAAVWLARTEPTRSRRPWACIAAVLVLMTLAAQSLGAIALLAIGTLALWARGRVQPRRAMASALLVLAVGGGVYLSGVVPITHLGKETALGRRIVDGLRSVGRGSFAWRISQDQKLLGDALRAPVTGSQQWDWWRPQGVRPWGLPLLAIGQFGLTGFVLMLCTLLAPAAAATWQTSAPTGRRDAGLPLLLTSLVLLALIDALLNSFFFFPAVIAAGALARPSRAVLH